MDPSSILYFFLCNFLQCIQVLNDLSGLLFKNPKISCQISEILIIFHKTFFCCTYCIMRLTRPCRGGRQKAHKGVPVEIWQYSYIHYHKGIFKYIIFHKWEFWSPTWDFWLLFKRERNVRVVMLLHSIPESSEHHSWFSKLKVFKSILKIGLGLQDRCCFWNVLPFNCTTPESQDLVRTCLKCTMCLAPNGSA